MGLLFVVIYYCERERALARARAEAIRFVFPVDVHTINITIRQLLHEIQIRKNYFANTTLSLRIDVSFVMS